MIEPASRSVVDASTVIAALSEERGGETAFATLTSALISAVNYTEVATWLVERGAPTQQVERDLAILGMQVLDFDGAQALEAARLQPLTRHRGLSLGDRACLALASLRRLPVMTADSAWAQVDVGIEINVIR